MNADVNILNWFEIPVTDMARAKKFYGHVFQAPFDEEQAMGDVLMAFFPYGPGNGKLSGSLALSPNHKPSKEGSVVYLNCNPVMDEFTSRVAEAGGMVVQPKTSIGNSGYIAMIIDTEGNLVGLHSIG